VAQEYVTALFDREASANDAKRALAAQRGVTVHQSFVVSRDDQGFHVDGRYAGEPPKHWYALLATTLARVLRGASREEDSVAIGDAEQELQVGQAALIALIDENIPNAADTAIRSYGGVFTRVSPGTLDAEDTERFLQASSLAGEL